MASVTATFSLEHQCTMYRRCPVRLASIFKTSGPLRPELFISIPPLSRDVSAMTLGARLWAMEGRWPIAALRAHLDPKALLENWDDTAKVTFDRSALERSSCRCFSSTPIATC